eukprot:5777116-Pleurochrysis_carterae.AAC.2
MEAGSVAARDGGVRRGVAVATEVCDACMLGHPVAVAARAFANERVRGRAIHASEVLEDADERAVLCEVKGAVYGGSELDRGAQELGLRDDHNADGGKQ